MAVVTGVREPFQQQDSHAFGKAEAVAVGRELARLRPDAFRPDLAMSLNNLSNRLADLGRREDALVAIEEAVTVRRDLFGQYPAPFVGPFVQSLAFTGYLLQGLGSTRAVLDVTLEAFSLASEHQLQDVAALVVSLIREERRAVGKPFDDVWREITGTGVPDEL
ncbi:tetratricopeptide repeat protein [Frankia sp. Cppng1_Ct_nod]|uniref:tetratricopeptide repeat protein n=1 Tax=Frankia sp. Cppng1_Ct_nod TaxID=2897162 RepID=UPI00104139F1